MEEDPSHDANIQVPEDPLAREEVDPSSVVSKSESDSFSPSVPPDRLFKFIRGWLENRDILSKLAYPSVRVNFEKGIRGAPKLSLEDLGLLDILRRVYFPPAPWEDGSEYDSEFEENAIQSMDAIYRARLDDKTEAGYCRRLLNNILECDYVKSPQYYEDFRKDEEEQKLKAKRAEKKREKNKRKRDRRKRKKQEQIEMPSSHWPMPPPDQVMEPPPMMGATHMHPFDDLAPRYSPPPLNYVGMQIQQMSLQDSPSTSHH